MFVWLAPATPRPSMPPEPTAVIDWLTLYVVPLGSTSGFTNPISLSFWYVSRTSTPAAGRNHRTESAMRAVTIARLARCFYGTPPQKSTARTADPYLTFDPTTG